MGDSLRRTLPMLLLLVGVGCAPDPSRYVEKNKHDELQSHLKEVQTKLDEVQKKLTEYESHRYSLFNSGFRTFRLDSITGET